MEDRAAAARKVAPSSALVVRVPPFVLHNRQPKLPKDGLEASCRSNQVGCAFSVSVCNTDLGYL